MKCGPHKCYGFEPLVRNSKPLPVVDVKSYEGVGAPFQWMPIKEIRGLEIPPMGAQE